MYYSDIFTPLFLIFCRFLTLIMMINDGLTLTLTLTLNTRHLTDLTHLNHYEMRHLKQKVRFSFSECLVISLTINSGNLALKALGLAWHFVFVFLFFSGKT